MKIRFGLSNGIGVGSFGVSRAGVSDTTAPTVTITCTQTSPSATSPLNYTFTFSESVTGFTIGDITAAIPNGTVTKSNFAGSGATYTCDLAPSVPGTMTVDVGAGVCQDTAGNNNLAATQFTFFFGLETFTYSDGALPSPWTGATWTVSSGAGINAPADGAEILTNGGMEGTYVGGIAPNWINAGGSTFAESADAHGGSKAQQLTNSSNVRQANNINVDLWVRYTAWFKKISGNRGGGILALNAAPFNTIADWGNITDTSYTQKIAVGRTTTTNSWNVRVDSAASSDVLYDDVSLKTLTLSSLFATLPSTVANVVAQVIVTVDPGRTQAGLVVNLDNAASPANFVIGYIDNAAGTVTAKLDKCVAGVYTNVISGSVTFGATKNLKVTKNGNTYQLWYGTPGSETQIGTDQTINSMNGTIHGLFSTSTVAKFDTYKLSSF